MRVSLAKLLLSEAGSAKKTGVNGGFLLLDEPTNHLDSNAKKWLQNWIKKYKGTILLVSHDEEVLRDVCTRIIEVKNKKLVSYAGSYSVFASEIRESERGNEDPRKNWEGDEKVRDVYKHVRRESDESKAGKG